MSRPRSLLLTLALVCSLACSAFGQKNTIDGLDGSLFRMDRLEASGREGAFPDGMNGLAMATTICNRGSVEIDWKAPMQRRHPFIAFMIVREHNGRLEQISDRSFVKHGFFAVNDSQCASCQDPGDPSLLGINCSDTYGVDNNNDRYWLAPADEVDPWLGKWDPVCSHFDRGEPAVDPPFDCDGIRSLSRGQVDAMGPVTHRIEVSDADLNVTGARFYHYTQYVIRGEAEVVRKNNSGHREFIPTWNGNRWRINELDGTSRGSILKRWEGALVRTAVNGEDDGRIYVGSKVTGPDAEGFYHYEFAIHNRDNRRGVGRFSIPTCRGASIKNIGFRDIDSDAGNDWTATVGSADVAFETTDNPVLWNTVYNFWFDSDAEPVEGNRSLMSQFADGDGIDALTGVVQAPMGPTRATNLGYAKEGGNGLAPDFRVCGSLGFGDVADIQLRYAAPSSPVFLFISDQNNPTGFAGGTLVPIPPIWIFAATTDSNGALHATANGPGGGITLYMQFVVADVGATEGVAISNALEVLVDP